MSSIRTQTLWSALPILVTSVVSIVTVPLYFSVLGDQMYAIWFYVGTLTGAFGFMDLGLGVAVGRYMGVAIGRNDNAAAQEYWSTGNVIVLPLVMLFAAIFVVLGAGYSGQWFNVADADTSTLQWAMLWGGVSLFFSYYGQMWLILAQTQLDFRFLSLLRTYCSLASSFGCIAVAMVSRSVAWIVAYTAIVAGTQFLILWRRGSTRYRLPLRWKDFRKERFLEMLPYTLKTFGHLISTSVFGSLDRLWLGRLAPNADFAAFNVAINFGSRITGLSVAVMGPVFHNTARGVGGDTARSPSVIYLETFKMLFPWLSLLIVGTFFWYPPILDVWLGSRAPTVAAAFPWVVTALSINAIANISTAQLGGLGRVGTGVIVQTIVALASAAFVVLGWTTNGLTGAAIGFLAARTVCIVQDLLVRRWIGVPLSQYKWSLFVILRQVAVVVPIWLISLPLKQVSHAPLLLAIISGCISGSLELRILSAQKRPPKTGESKTS